MDELEECSSENGNYVLVDYIVTNTGDETLETNDIYNAKLSNPEEEHGGSKGNAFYYESIVAEGAIEPGESFEGQFIFDYDITDQYRLIHNFALPATEITWILQLMKQAIKRLNPLC